MSGLDAEAGIAWPAPVSLRSAAHALCRLPTPSPATAQLRQPAQHAVQLTAKGHRHSCLSHC